MNSERIIPLSSISDEFNITVQSPPPFRNYLGVDVGILDDTLRTLRLEDTPIKLDFYRDEPRVSVAPRSVRQIDGATMDIAAEEEKPRKRESIYVDLFTGSVLLSIPYKDRDVRTPEKTAKTSSEKLRRNLVSVPKAIYRQEFGESDFDYTNVPMYEIFSFGQSLAYSSIALILCHAYMEYNKTINGIIGFGLIYGILSSVRAIDLHRFRNGKKSLFANDEFMPFYDEDPRRILYPVKFTEEIVVPAFLWQMRRNLHNADIITPDF